MIGTCWVFSYKLDEDGNVLRNKTRLVGKGYNQKEEIYVNETYPNVALL